MNFNFGSRLKSLTNGNPNATFWFKSPNLTHRFSNIRLMFFSLFHTLMTDYFLYFIHTQKSLSGHTWTPSPYRRISDVGKLSSISDFAFLDLYRWGSCADVGFHELQQHCASIGGHPGPTRIGFLIQDFEDLHYLILFHSLNISVFLLFCSLLISIFNK